MTNDELSKASLACMERQNKLRLLVQLREYEKALQPNADRDLYRLDMLLSTRGVIASATQMVGLPEALRPAMLDEIRRQIADTEKELKP